MTNVCSCGHDEHSLHGCRRDDCNCGISIPVIAIIPARKGSKRLPGKNMKTIRGKSLVEHAIECAKSSSFVSRIVVSSDDEEVLFLSRKLNCDTIERDPLLCKDETPMSDVIDDVVRRLSIPNAIYILLQPTSPQRIAYHLNSALRTFVANPFLNSLRSVNYMERPEGTVYIFKKILNENPCLNMVVDWDIVDINTPEEFESARMKMEEIEFAFNEVQD